MRTEVYFAHESIDLHIRSSRLSADFVAVVAADFTRSCFRFTLVYQAHFHLAGMWAIALTVTNFQREIINYGRVIIYSR